MALIKIGTTDLPTPSEYSVSINDLTKAERTANGTMTIDRVATKRKIELSWRYLSRNDLQTMLNLFNDVKFQVTYMDPVTNANRTSYFYVGDRSVGMLDFVNSVPRYKEIKFNLIEI